MDEDLTPLEVLLGWLLELEIVVLHSVSNSAGRNKVSLRVWRIDFFQENIAPATSAGNEREMLEVGSAAATQLVRLERNYFELNKLCRTKEEKRLEGIGDLVWAETEDVVTDLGEVD